MPVAPCNSVLSDRTNELWCTIERSVAEACLLRAEGRNPEAITIVQQTLPSLIAEWSRCSGLSSEHCQRTLRELFARVQQQVSTATLCKRLVLQSVASGEAAREATPERFQIKRRVPLHDIPAMLDALDEGERAAQFRQQNFSTRAVRFTPAMALG